MAVLHRSSQACATFADLLAKCGVPAATKRNYRAASDEVAVLTYHSSKGLDPPPIPWTVGLCSKSSDSCSQFVLNRLR
jgi:hypothetical protein